MKKFCLLLILLAGCTQIIPQPSATTGQLEAARAYAAAVLALAPGESTPGPTPPGPTPPPLPDRICDNCGGDGEVGDGRIIIKCAVCDGTGRITLQQEIDRQAALIRELKGELLRLAEDHDAEVQAREKAEQWIADEMAKVKAKPKAKPKAKLPVGAGVDWRTSATQARTEAATTGKPLFMHWWMEGCQPCAYVEANIFTDIGVCTYINDNFIPIKINAKKQSAEVRADWEISGVPAERIVRADYTGEPLKFNAAPQPANWLLALESAKRWAERPRQRITSEIVPVRVMYQNSYQGNCSDGSCEYGGWSGSGGCATCQ